MQGPFGRAVVLEKSSNKIVSFLFVTSLVILAPSSSFAFWQDGSDVEKRVTFEVKDRDLAEVVEYIRQGTSMNVVLDEGIEAKVTLSLNRVPWRQALEIAANKAGCVVIEMGDNLLKVEKPPVVHFAFENADITKVIDAIAKVSGANIIVGPEVKGTVSVRLNNVPYRDALESVVKTLGYVVVQEKRGILRITDPSTLKAQVESRSYQLRYIRPQGPYTPILESDFVSGPKKGTAGATDLKKSFRLLEAFEKALSSNGRLDYIDKQNVLVVTDVAPVLDRIQKIVDRVDVEPRQVFVDVKFVSTANTEVFKAGIDYGGAGPIASMQLGSTAIELPFHVGQGGFEDSIIPHNGDNAGPWTVQGDDPGENPGDLEIPSTIFGSLNFNEVSAALRLIQSDANSDIIQAPKVIALDHQAATIFVGERVPYAEVRTEQGQAGGLQISVVEASKSPVSIGFQLLMIPHVVPGTDKIMMDMIPTQNSLTGSSPASSISPAGFEIFTLGNTGATSTIALPRIGSSTMATTMMLESGHTAVIGGLSTISQSYIERGIPGLMDIPILGWLFRFKDSSDDRRNLIVLITPTVIRSTEEQDSLLERELDKRAELYRSRLEELFPVRTKKTVDSAETKPE